MRSYYFLIKSLSFFLLISSRTYSQTSIGFTMIEGKDRVEIPVEIINNLVVLPVTINGFLPLHFVLDTGVETAILTEPDYAPLLQVKYVRQITVAGAGVQDSINAYVGQGLQFELPNGVIGRNMNMIILDDDYLKLSQKMGRDVHGIIGYDIFNNFVVEIDYDQNQIILHNPKSYKPRKRLPCIDIEIRNSRPYVFTRLSQNKTLDDTVKLMIDSGASHAILLDAAQSKISVPVKTIKTHLGTGLGGEIPGRMGRIDELSISEFEFKSILVSIPNPDAYSQSIKRGSRQGTLGGEILSRLNPIFDYRNRKLYLSKTRSYKRPFEYDMSGIGLMTRGTFLDTLVVDYIKPDSPAEKVGVQKGDKIVSINSLSLKSTSLNNLVSLLKIRPKKKIKLRILRDGEKIKKEFKLKRAI